MVSFVSVAEMIYFDAVKANVMRRVIEMLIRLSQRLCLLYLVMLSLASLYLSLSLPLPRHVNDLCNPISKGPMNIALNRFYNLHAMPITSQ